MKRYSSHDRGGSCASSFHAWTGLPFSCASAFVTTLTLYLLFCISCSADDFTLLGGDLSTDLTGHNAIQVGAPNIGSRERLQRQLSGFEIFHRINEKADGLGPRYINSSCGGCHVENGKGPISFNSLFNGGSTALIKVALPGLKRDRSPRPVPDVGLQLDDLSVDGTVHYNINVTWEKKAGRYPDRRRYTLRKPHVSFAIPGIPQTSIAYSLRMSPLLIGLGLLEAIPESDILAKGDPKDSNRDGIAGKPNYVIDKITNQKKLGRFGFKATQPTLAQQSGVAAFGDMGLTNPLFPGKNNSTELSADDFDRLLLYLQIPGVPRARDQGDPEVQHGAKLFQNIGCSACHTMTFVTGESTAPELAHQVIHPFSDLLLHDMGSGLADKRAEFDAKGSEWRTTPLWGLGFAGSVSEVKPLYLHDGRARSIEEAILWHGGEASRSRRLFMKLSRAERNALLNFLRSL